MSRSFVAAIVLFSWIIVWTEGSPLPPGQPSAGPPPPDPETDDLRHDCQALMAMTGPQPPLPGGGGGGRLPGDREMLELAMAAYYDRASWGCWRHGEVKVSATLDERTGYWVLAWRGTSLGRAGDLSLDFDLLPVNDPVLGIVHRGYRWGVEGVAQQIIRDTAHIGDRLTMTGHSMGGAMALLFGGLLAAAGRPAASIVTFGTPRMSGHRLAGLLAGTPGTDYCASGDPICNAPIWMYGHPRPPLNVVVPPLPVAREQVEEAVLDRAAHRYHHETTTTTTRKRRSSSAKEEEDEATQRQRRPRLRFLDIFLDHFDTAYWGVVTWRMAHILTLGAVPAPVSLANAPAAE